MIGSDIKVTEDGAVHGTLHAVTGFTGFNPNNPDEQTGHYFPIRLTQAGGKMTLKKDGIAGPGKTDMAFDSDIIFRITTPKTTYTIEVDDQKVVDLNFSEAILE